jgi:hypothetical protein
MELVILVSTMLAAYPAHLTLDFVTSTNYEAPRYEISSVTSSRLGRYIFAQCSQNPQSMFSP